MINQNPLQSLAGYSSFIAEILNHPSVRHSTVSVWSDSPYTGTAEGEVWFVCEIRLRIREELDFETGIISAYGYEVYRGDERLYWYDDFPHPNDPELASTHPHQKHIPPDTKHHRVPAPEMSFSRPNLSVLIRDIEKLIG